MFNIVKLENLLDEKVKARFNGISGIYGIILQNEICYIGQTKNLYKRWNEHKHHIIRPYDKCKRYRGDYKSPYPELRNAYNGYGNIYFICLEYVHPIERLTEREKYYLNEFKPKYNKRF